MTIKIEMEFQSGEQARQEMHVLMGLDSPRAGSASSPMQPSGSTLSVGEMLDAVQAGLPEGMQVRVINQAQADLLDGQPQLTGLTTSPSEATSDDQKTAPSGESSTTQPPKTSKKKARGKKKAAASKKTTAQPGAAESSTDGAPSSSPSDDSSPSESTSEQMSPPSGGANGSSPSTTGAETGSSGPGSTPETSGATPAPDISVADMRTAATDLLHPLFSAGGEAEQGVRDILAGFDVQRFSDIPDEKVSELYEKARALAEQHAN